MPRKPPPESTWFKPGQSGNISGRPKLPPEIKEAYKLTQTRFIELVNKYLSMNREEISLASQDPKATTLDLIVLKILQQAIVKGDQIRLTFLLDRLLGKLPNSIDMAINPNVLEYVKQYEGKSTQELVEEFNKIVSPE